MDLKLPKMLCKDSKQHHVMFHELNSVSSLLCIAQNVRFEIPYKDLYFETPFLMIFKCYAWASYGKIFHDTYSTQIHRAKLTISHNCSNYKTSESQAFVFSLSMIGNKSFMAQEAIHGKMFAHISY